MLAGGQRLDVGEGHAIGPEAGMVERFARRRVGMGPEYKGCGQASRREPPQRGAPCHAGGSHGGFLSGFQRTSDTDTCPQESEGDRSLRMGAGLSASAGRTEWNGFAAWV